MAADRIVLTVPARDEYARVVRMTAASLASRAGASVDCVEDVKLAVEEAYIYASELSNEGDEVTFVFVVDDDMVTVEVGPLGVEGEAADAPSDRYSRFILESVCDAFETRESEGGHRISLSKRLV